VNVNDAREFVKQFARNAAGSNSQYTLEEIDRSIQAVCDRFILKTRCTRRTDTLTLTINSSVLPALPTNFRPEKLLRVWIPSQGRLTRVDHGGIIDRQLDEGATGVPEYIGFDSFTSGEVYPTPDVAYSVKLQWVEPFTTWTAGGNDPGTALNIPDDYLRLVLMYGASSILQFNEPKNPEAKAKWKEYLNFEEGFENSGSLGAATTDRSPVEE
jgi:hypothetical protein